MSDYKIGYMKPPRDKQFKPGQSGNPKGRPSGAQSTYSIVNEIVNEKVTVTKNGKKVRMPNKRFMISKLVNDANQGNLKALQTLLPLMLAADAKNEELARTSETISQDDMEIINLAINRGKYGKANV